MNQARGRSHVRDLSWNDEPAPETIDQWNIAQGDSTRKDTSNFSVQEHNHLLDFSQDLLGQDTFPGTLVELDSWEVISSGSDFSAKKSSESADGLATIDLQLALTSVIDNEPSLQKQTTDYIWTSGGLGFTPDLGEQEANCYPSPLSANFTPKTPTTPTLPPFKRQLEMVKGKVFVRKLKTAKNSQTPPQSTSCGWPRTRS